MKVNLQINKPLLSDMTDENDRNHLMNIGADVPVHYHRQNKDLEFT